MSHILDLIQAEFPELLPDEWMQIVFADEVLGKAYLAALKDDEVSGTAGIGAEVLQGKYNSDPLLHL